MVNESITDCLPNPGKIPIISQSYQPNQLLARPLLSHPNCPLCSPPLCLSLASFTMLSCHPPPALRMPECQPNLFCFPPLYPLGFFYLPITPQPPFTCLSLSHSSLGSPIPHLTKFCPLPKPQFVFNLWPSTPHLLMSIYFSFRHPVTPLSLLAAFIFVLSVASSLPPFLSLSFPISFHPFFFLPPVFADPVVQSILPTSLVWGCCLVPEYSLGDTKPCQLPMSLLEHSTFRQTDADTHKHNNTTHISPHAHTPVS